MTEEQLIEAFSKATRLHAIEGFADGLHPVHVANALMLAAIQIAVECEGIEKTRAGLWRAADNLGAHGNG